MSNCFNDEGVPAESAVWWIDHLLELLQSEVGSGWNSSDYGSDEAPQTGEMNHGAKSSGRSGSDWGCACCC